MSTTKVHKRRVEFSGTIPLSQAAAELRDIADGLGHGSLQVQRIGQELSLTPTESVHLEFDAKQKECKERLSITISWERVPTPDDPHGLVISDARCDNAAACHGGETAAEGVPAPSHRRPHTESHSRRRKARSRPDAGSKGRGRKTRG